jgi:hypothetical protein
MTDFDRSAVETANWAPLDTKSLQTHGERIPMTGERIRTVGLVPNRPTNGDTNLRTIFQTISPANSTTTQTICAKPSRARGKLSDSMALRHGGVTGQEATRLERFASEFAFRWSGAGPANRASAKSEPMHFGLFARLASARSDVFRHHCWYYSPPVAKAVSGSALLTASGAARQEPKHGTDFALFPRRSGPGSKDHRRPASIGETRM